jgi:hypothetical protein
MSQLDHLRNELQQVLSLQCAMQEHQEKQDRELESMKLQIFIDDRVFTYHEAYEFIETLLMNACDKDAKV